MRCGSEQKGSASPQPSWKPEGDCSHLLTDDPPAVGQEEPGFAHFPGWFLCSWVKGSHSCLAFCHRDVKIFVLEQMDKGSKAQTFHGCGFGEKGWTVLISPCFGKPDCSLGPAWCAPGLTSSQPGLHSCGTVRTSPSGFKISSGECQTIQSKRCWDSRAACKCHRMESCTLGLLGKYAAKILPAAAEQEGR